MLVGRGNKRRRESFSCYYLYSAAAGILRLDYCYYLRLPFSRASVD